MVELTDGDGLRAGLHLRRAVCEYVTPTSPGTPEPDAWCPCWRTQAGW
ncbi:hypothetical protein HBB16_07455 [Pseudonocardia sp. MCCB 268]|nr:hypothetical protein [Pseudonocardia cytotoxica]